MLALQMRPLHDTAHAALSLADEEAWRFQLTHSGAVGYLLLVHMPLTAFIPAWHPSEVPLATLVAQVVCGGL